VEYRLTTQERFSDLTRFALLFCYRDFQLVGFSNGRTVREKANAARLAALIIAMYRLLVLISCTLPRMAR